MRSAGVLVLIAMLFPAGAHALPPHAAFTHQWNVPKHHRPFMQPQARPLPAPRAIARPAPAMDFGRFSARQLLVLRRLGMMPINPIVKVIFGANAAKR